MANFMTTDETSDQVWITVSVYYKKKKRSTRHLYKPFPIYDRLQSVRFILYIFYMIT